MWKTRTKIKTD